MHQKKIYSRKVRLRSDSCEIVIPKPLFVDLELGEYNYLNVWINRNWGIEISNGEKPLNDINGVVLHRQVYRHGSSWAFIIPHEIVDTLEIWLNKKLEDVKIFKNKNGNIIFQPYDSIDISQEPRNNKRLKISYNIGTYKYVYYLK